MRVTGLEHVQLAMPRGGERQAREFYMGVLGLPEVPKPAELASRGGVWFENQSVKIHLGVEDDFRPARKAHPALLVEELGTLIALLRRQGFEVAEDRAGDAASRVYVSDPFGNRIELIEAHDAGGRARP